MAHIIDGIEKCFMSDGPNSTLTVITLEDALKLEKQILDLELENQILEIKVRTLEKEIEYYHGRING